MTIARRLGGAKFASTKRVHIETGQPHSLSRLHILSNNFDSVAIEMGNKRRARRLRERDEEARYLMGTVDLPDMGFSGHVMAMGDSHFSTIASPQDQAETFHLGSLAIPSSPPLPAFDDQLSPTSSEPPIFSSDDPRESEDVLNYTTPRLKRKRTGPWWIPDPKEEGDPMRAATDPKIPWLLSKRKSRKSRYDIVTDYTYLTFYSKLQSDVDRGLEIFDYSHSDLMDIDLRHIGRLNQLIAHIPDPGEDAPADGQFRSMVPCIRLFLADNKFIHLHPQLFNVEHITYLSLKSNDIEELPPQIAQLRNLKRLDLSLNKLGWLPYELNELYEPSGRLHVIHTMGNPLIQPVDTDNFRTVLHDNWDLEYEEGELRERMRQLQYAYERDNDVGALLVQAWIDQFMASESLTFRL
jgi:hypothetical protein